MPSLPAVPAAAVARQGAARRRTSLGRANRARGQPAALPRREAPSEPGGTFPAVAQRRRSVPDTGPATMCDPRPRPGAVRLARRVANVSSTVPGAARGARTVRHATAPPEGFDFCHRRRCEWSSRPGAAVRRGANAAERGGVDTLAGSPSFSPRRVGEPCKQRRRKPRKQQA